MREVPSHEIRDEQKGGCHGEDVIGKGQQISSTERAMAWGEL